MDIGGKDIWIEDGSETQWQAAQQYFKALWPDHVTEKVAEDELFIFRNQTVLEQMDQEGVTEELDDQYVHLLREDSGFTVVVSSDFDDTELRQAI